MKKTANPSPDTWRHLYQLAAQIHQLAPWHWMDETEIFGVQHPETGQTGFVSVMGQLGEHRAIALYPSERALHALLGLIEEAELDGDPDPMHLLEIPKIELSFEEKSVLEKEDLALHKKLGLKFRGKQGWPMFRSLEVGYLPWFLTPDEAQFLAYVLEQVLDVAARFRADDSVLYPGEKDDLDDEHVFLVRVRDDHGLWHDTTRTVEPPLAEKLIQQEMPAELIAQLKELPRNTSTLELELQMAPMPASDKPGDRPFFPYLFLLADSDSGMVLGMELLEPKPTRDVMYTRVPTILANKLVERGSLPRRFRVRTDTLGDLLEPLAEQLQIHLRQAEKLTAIDSAIDFLATQAIGKLGLGADLDDDMDDFFDCKIDLPFLR